MNFTVIGFPISHTLSPPMQNAALEYWQMEDAQYGKMEVKPEDIESFVQYAKENLNGFNLTIPHKAAILPFLEDCTAEAIVTQSVNTVMVLNGKLYGTSTDGYGLTKAIYHSFGFELKGKRVIFSGCGGVTMATAFYAAKQGVKKISLFNRTKSKAILLAEKLMKNFPDIEVVYGSFEDENFIRNEINNCDIFIQSTSLGLKDSDSFPFDYSLFDDAKNIYIFDTIYRETNLLKYAKKMGIAHANGLAMLLYQGAKAFEFWTNKCAEDKGMIMAMKKALEDNGGVFICST